MFTVSFIFLYEYVHVTSFIYFKYFFYFYLFTTLLIVVNKHVHIVRGKLCNRPYVMSDVFACLLVSSSLVDCLVMFVNCG